jgi:hypothetical protein
LFLASITSGFNISFLLLGLFGVLCMALPMALSVKNSNSRRSRAARRAYELLLLAVSAHEQWHRQKLEKYETDCSRQLINLQNEHQLAKGKMNELFQPKLVHLQTGFTNITDRINKQSPAWTTPDWQIWRVSITIPLVTRIGKFNLTVQKTEAAIAAIYSFPRSRSLLFKINAASKRFANRGVQSLLIRLLATTPPGKLRFTFIDPVGLGQNAAPFMHLADYDAELVAGKAWTEPRHIDQQLADLTEHVENIFQKYLRDQFATIEDYNAQAGEVSEPYRLLVVFDFPTNFSQDAARRLTSIVQTGPRCGVFTILLVDSEKPLPYGFSLDDLERYSNVIAWNDDHFVWQSDEDFKHCTLVLDSPPDIELTKRVVQTVGEAAVVASKVEVPFDRVVPPTEQFWTGDSRNGLRVALGPSGARKLQYLDLGKGTAQHALVAGKTGSGKSNLLHVLITNLALTYSPDEVALYLIDFKKGVEFKSYATHQLPHARVIAIESEREFGLSTLQGLDAELKRRGDLFRAAGVDGLADYRQKQGGQVTLPRILLLVDEFQEFFTEDDAIASQSAQILDRLVRQGRAFGIHVLLGSQTLAGSYSLARSTIDQMAVRIALQCSEADSRLILADDNPAARLLSRPGEAIYNTANGLVEGNNPFQVVLLPDEARDRHIKQVKALALARGYRPQQPQIVFEGNVPAEVEKNSLLADALNAPTPTAPTAPTRSVRAWIGEPIAIKDPTAASFRRQSGSNLLIVGQSDEAALGMMTTALVSLAAQSPIYNLQPRFYVLDFAAVDGPHAEFFDRLAGLLKPAYPIKIGRRRQLLDFLSELDTEVKRRLDSDSAASQSAVKTPIYLLVYGLHRARDLRQDEGFGFSMGQESSPPNPTQQFASILREGPDLGVHTLVWCDTLTNLNHTLDRRTLREFAMRVAFQMSGEDSANLIDTPAASKLGPYRALFYSEEENRVEKFRPYGLPTTEWLTRVAEQLQLRSNRK